MGITVLRCDDRLIHGQCIVKVLNDYKIDYIILVDAFTASNPRKQCHIEIACGNHTGNISQILSTRITRHSLHHGLPKGQHFLSAQLSEHRIRHTPVISRGGGDTKYSGAGNLEGGDLYL